MISSRVGICWPLSRRICLYLIKDQERATGSTDEARDDNDLFLEDFEAIVLATMGTGVGDPTGVSAEETW
eukprot:scaffold1391_cov95-Skeletonema_marinoi.AAC.2